MSKFTSSKEKKTVHKIAVHRLLDFIQKT